ncbi:hypothetical protein E2C01_031785 [Portunus trituberculatus]|uniref:Uncharacterized protein n=1 Tax=Portunus trituberculatus TaxID=210409 RepID=A0A5B7EZ42_PORTR|nr:hypothetical protein [Portunus trituberculatus]
MLGVVRNTWTHLAWLGGGEELTWPGWRAGEGDKLGAGCGEAGYEGRGLGSTWSEGDMISKNRWVIREARKVESQVEMVVVVASCPPSTFQRLTLPYITCFHNVYSAAVTSRHVLPRAAFSSFELWLTLI